MVAMVVIRCPETDREVPTGIMTDLARFDRLGEGYADTAMPTLRPASSLVEA